MNDTRLGMAAVIILVIILIIQIVNWHSIRNMKRKIDLVDLTAERTYTIKELVEAIAKPNGYPLADWLASISAATYSGGPVSGRPPVDPPPPKATVSTADELSLQRYGALTALRDPDPRPGVPAVTSVPVPLPPPAPPVTIEPGDEVESPIFVAVAGQTGTHKKIT